MRSQLLPLNSNCALKKSCTFCGSLGYTASKADFDVESYFHHSLTRHTVFPCSTFEDQKYQKMLQPLKAKQHTWSQVFTWDYYCSQRPELSNQPIDNFALIFTDFQKVQAVDKCVDYYFLLNEKTWSLDKWKDLSYEKKSMLKFFFTPPDLDSVTDLTPEDFYQIKTMIRREVPQAAFSHPFDHDVQDKRNKDHFYWNLKADNIRNNILSERPKISVIIPFTNRSLLLEKVLKNIAVQTLDVSDFEIILVDDGSHPAEQKSFLKILDQHKKFSWTYIYTSRNIPLSQTHINNRAGPTRNLGALYARGDYYLFLDSDILLPADYLEKILFFHLHQKGIILPVRIYLNESFNSSGKYLHSEVTTDDCVRMPWQNYIEEFYRQQNWKQNPTPWKYFITYCLSMTAEQFKKIGGFRNNYISFGYEDLDLGFRAIEKNIQLQLLDVPVYHLFHFTKKDEYPLNIQKRNNQLAVSALTFLTQNIPDNGEYLTSVIQLKERSYRFKQITDQLKNRTLAFKQRLSSCFQ